MIVYLHPQFARKNGKNIQIDNRDLQKAGMGSETPKIDEFKLSQELKGHSGDVRVVATSNDLIISGSRDKTVRVWKKIENG